MLAIVQIAKSSDAMCFELVRNFRQRKEEGARDIIKIDGGYIKILVFFAKKEEEEAMRRVFLKLQEKADRFSGDNFQIMDIDINELAAV